MRPARTLPTRPSRMQLRKAGLTTDIAQLETHRCATRNPSVCVARRAPARRLPRFVAYTGCSPVTSDTGLRCCPFRGPTLHQHVRTPSQCPIPSDRPSCCHAHIGQPHTRSRVTRHRRTRPRHCTAQRCTAHQTAPLIATVAFLAALRPHDGVTLRLCTPACQTTARLACPQRHPKARYQQKRASPPLLPLRCH